MTTESELAQAQGDILQLQQEVVALHEKIGNIENALVKVSNRTAQQDAALGEIGAVLPAPIPAPANPVEKVETQDLVADGIVNDPNQMSLPEAPPVPKSTERAAKTVKPDDA